MSGLTRIDFTTPEHLTSSGKHSIIKAGKRASSVWSSNHMGINSLTVHYSSAEESFVFGPKRVDQSTTEQHLKVYMTNQFVSLGRLQAARILFHDNEQATKATYWLDNVDANAIEAFKAWGFK